MILNIVLEAPNVQPKLVLTLLLLLSLSLLLLLIIIILNPHIF